MGGENGYLWPIHTAFNNIKYLFNSDIYGSLFAIYDGQKPVGYIELTDILVMNKTPLVDIAYAILEEERKKGYATKTLLQVSKLILTDPMVQKATLNIVNRNITSQRVVEKAGFIRDTSLDVLATIGYQKKQKICYRPVFFIA